MNKNRIIIVSVAAVLAVLAIVLTIVFLPDTNDNKSEGDTEIDTVHNSETDKIENSGDDPSNENAGNSEINDNYDGGTAETSNNDSTVNSQGSDGKSDVDGDEGSSGNSSPQNSNDGSEDKESSNDGEGNKENNSPSVDGSDGEASVPAEMTYEEYIALSPAEQQVYFESFEGIDDYFEWYNKAKEEYEDKHPPIEIGGDDNGIDIGEIIDGGN